MDTGASLFLVEVLGAARLLLVGEATSATATTRAVSIPPGDYNVNTRSLTTPVTSFPPLAATTRVTLSGRPLSQQYR